MGAPGQVLLTDCACLPSADPCPASHLQLVHELLLDGILGCGIGCHAEPFCCLTQPLLLLLAVWVGCSSLEKSENPSQLSGTMESLSLLKQHLCSGLMPGSPPQGSLVYGAQEMLKLSPEESSSRRGNSSSATTHSFLKLLHRRSPRYCTGPWLSARPCSENCCSTRGCSSPPQH